MDVIEVALKNWLYGGRMVAVDTSFTVSAAMIEAAVKTSGAKSWGWRLNDGVVTFYVPRDEAPFIRSLFLNRKILAIVL